MRLLFFRHGDPDYVIDGLTDKGNVEAKLLAERIKTFGIDEVYQSPLGRARATADYSLKELSLPVTTYEWLQEFPALFDANKASEDTKSAYKSELKMDASGSGYEKRIVWDMMPSYYAHHPELFDPKAWRESDVVKASDTLSVYDNIIENFDKFLLEHGYKRNGDIYEAVKGNDKTIALFCHFGVTCVMLSHLFNISPFVPLQFFAMAPTSVTEVVTEEREKGIAIFRALRIGDITHLTMGGEEPSFAARFCERFENEGERH
ncbi:histidine phosphatase family protein [Butyrivibrio sp. CB08]|uniref:histidine phosphatase family protein n=1 Tax=Butyrivibrio sp. CB08 TaxID=2364879 RepID=UPI000EAA864C|nr:histidine phosphatase family protein [Butyrivibrio sp. CB08]RKM61424.1 histidine phosphatase family protein [Butyrivibrio sp. CB08]